MLNQSNDDKIIDVTKETDDRTYNFIVITYALLISILSMFIEDLSIIFGVFATFSEIFTDFFFPVFILFYAYRSIK